MTSSWLFWLQLKTSEAQRGSGRSDDRRVETCWCHRLDLWTYSGREHRHIMTYEHRMTHEWWNLTSSQQTMSQNFPNLKDQRPELEWILFSLKGFGFISLRSWSVCDSPQSVPSPVPLDSEVSISSGLDRKSKTFSTALVSGSSLVSMLVDEGGGFFLMI